MLPRMAASIPTAEPSVLRKGDTLAFTITEPDYPASQGWSLAYALVNSTAKYEFSSTADGDAHAISVAATTTGTYIPGRYRWVRAAVKGAERYTLREGDLEIKPDPTSGAYDPRTHARKTLEAIESWIEGHDPAVASYRIGDRQMQYIPIGELLQLRSRYQREVGNETALDQGRLPHRLQVRL